MGAAWQASGTLAATSGIATHTPVNPAHQTDDILIAQTTRQTLTQTCTCNTPGWALLAGPVTGATLIRTYWFWKKAESSSETNPGCTWSSATGSNTFSLVHNVRGADLDDPFDVVATRQDQADPFILTPGIDTTVANQRVIVVGFSRDQLGTAVTVTSTDPTTYTQRDYQESSFAGNCIVTFHEAIRVAAGSTGDITLDFDAAQPDDGHYLVATFNDPPLPEEPSVGIPPITQIAVPQGGMRW